MNDIYYTAISKLYKKGSLGGYLKDRRRKRLDKTTFAELVF